jgi:hypothetical protein
MSSRRRCANASDEMPSAESTAGLTKPSGSRSCANCGSFLNRVRTRSSLGVRCSLSAAAARTRSRISAVEREAAHLGRVEHLRVDRRHLPARPVDPLAQRVVELGLADLVARDRRHGLPVVALHAAVALDPEENERREHQQHEHELQDTGVAAEEIEHGTKSDARKANCDSRRIAVRLLMGGRRRF